MDQAQDTEDTPGVVPGMKLDLPSEENAAEDTEEGLVLTKPMPEPKTKLQRRKAAKLLAEVHSVEVIFVLMLIR